MTNRKSEAAASALAMALPAVERLRQTVAAENEDIAQGRPVPYESYSLRKNQGLLELNRLLPALVRGRAAGPLRDALSGLNAELEINRRALGVQLKASIAVAEIVSRAIHDGQSDGTYDARCGRQSDGAYDAAAWRIPRA